MRESVGAEVLGGEPSALELPGIEAMPEIEQLLGRQSGKLLGSSFSKLLGRRSGKLVVSSRTSGAAVSRFNTGVSTGRCGNSYIPDSSSDKGWVSIGIPASSRRG